MTAHNTRVTLLAIDARCLMGKPSGMGRYAANLLPALVAQASQDVSFCVVRHESNRDLLDWPQGADVEEVFVSSRVAYPPDFFLAGKALRAALSSRGTPDLIHGLFHVLPWNTHSLAPTVVSLLDLILIDHARESQSNWVEAQYTKAFGKLAIGATLRGAAHILSISEASKVAAHRHFGPLPMSVVSLGVEDAFFDPPRPVERATNERPYVLTVSNDKPYKNVDVLLRAFKDPKLAAKADLVLVGPEAGLKRLAQEVGVQAKVPGFVPEQEYGELLAGASAFVFPSLIEGFGLPPVEAMAGGVPTLVSNIEPMRTICTPGAETFDARSASDLAAKLHKLLDDAEWHQTRHQAARAHADSFRWPITARETLQAYERVLGRSLLREHVETTR